MSQTLNYFFNFMCRYGVRPAHWYAGLYMFCFTISVFQNWRMLYHEEEAKIANQLMKGLPRHCQNGRNVFAAVVNYLGSFFQSPTDDCLRYYQALQAKPYEKATLIQALSMTIVQYFTTPLEYIGENISKFFSGTMRHIPILMSPLVLIMVFIVGLFLIIIYAGYEISFPFNLGAIRPARYTALMAGGNNFGELQYEDPRLREKRIQNLRLEYNRKLSSSKTRPLLYGKRNKRV